MNSLYKFPGGLKLPQDTDSALERPIQTMPLPAYLEYPLQTPRGTPRRALVKTEESVTAGQVLAVADGDVPLLASAAGIVERVSTSILLRTMEDLIDSTTGNLQSVASQPIDSIESNLHRLQSMGVQGLGGAAFPGFKKLSSAAGRKIDTLIVNAAECEPQISCDQALIRAHCDDILPGVAYLKKLSGATECLIGIEDCMTTEIELLTGALERWREQNGLKHSYRGGISLVPIPTIYPTGGEKQLIRVLTGRQIAESELPRDQGVLCFNIATAYAVKRALCDHHPQLDRIVTITGNAVSQPANVLVKFGTRLADLMRWMNLTEAAGDTVTMGGPLSGVRVVVQETSISAASNCFIIGSPSGRIGGLHAHRPTYPCIRCGECDTVCPVKLLPQQLHWFCRDSHTTDRNQSNLQDAEKFHVTACIECGCCDFVCPSNISLTAQFRRAKHQSSELRRQSDFAARAEQRHQAKTQRLERKERLRQLKLQQRKAALGKKRQARNRGIQQ